MSGTTELPKFTVFLDSCCLFTKNDSEIVDHKFTQLFRELSSKCDLQLAVPRIVIQEILSQKTFQCGTFLHKAKSSLKQIEKLTRTNLDQPPTIEELQATLEKRFDNWVADLGALVIDIPIDIDWPALIDNAVWRRPPFSPRTEENPTSEKGFKDALILEALLGFQKYAQEREIVFVCADALLSGSATSRLTDQPKFLVVKSLEEFGSHVDLLLNQQNEAFIGAVLGKIGGVFFTENDPNCLWFKCDVLKQVHEALGVRWSGAFGDVYEPPLPTYLPRLLSSETVPKPLKPVTEEAQAIGETAFVPNVDSEFYHWSTRVELRQIFGPRGVPADVAASLLSFNSERLRRLVVNVKWKCRISPEINFTDEAIEGVELVSETFETPDGTARMELRHPFFSQAADLERNLGTTL
jgi:hypothetical protein